MRYLDSQTHRDGKFDGGCQGLGREGIGEVFSEGEAELRGLWDFSSPARDRTRALGSESLES